LIVERVEKLENAIFIFKKAIFFTDSTSTLLPVWFAFGLISRQNFQLHYNPKPYFRWPWAWVPILLSFLVCLYWKTKVYPI